MVPIPLDPTVLERYRAALHYDHLEDAACGLARAIAASPGWGQFPGADIVVRPDAAPALAVAGVLDTTQLRELSAKARNAAVACARLRYVDYRDAEHDCRMLADRLIEQFGADTLRGYRFVALPRGGLIVLGMLAKMLDLPSDRLSAGDNADAPVVVVDDCALTGYRFGRFLRHARFRNAVFATLYAPAPLLAAIQRNEPTVTDALSARTLVVDEAATGTTPAELWRQRLAAPRYWIGACEHVCFPWNEPERPYWNAMCERVEPAWRIVAPDRCFANEPGPGEVSATVAIQTPGRGPIRPAATVMYRRVQDAVAVTDLVSGEAYRLADTAMAMWQAVVAHGTVNGALQALMDQYDVDARVVESDLRAFIDRLLNTGLLQDSRATARS